MSPQPEPVKLFSAYTSWFSYQFTLPTDAVPGDIYLSDDGSIFRWDGNLWQLVGAVTRPERIANQFFGWSGTALSLNPGISTLTTREGLAFLPGDRVRLSAQGGLVWMEGQVLWYRSRELSVYIDTCNGDPASAWAGWNINLVGRPGWVASPAATPVQTSTPRAPVPKPNKIGRLIDLEEE